MATWLLCKQSRVITYMTNMRIAAGIFRSFSGYDESHSVGEGYIAVDGDTLHLGDKRKWPNSSLGPLNPKDKHFPLPGMVGMAPTSENVTRINNKTINNQRSKEFAIDELMHGDEQHSKVIKLQTFIANSQDLDRFSENITSSSKSPFHKLECSITLCPEILKKDFSDLFPDRDLSKSDLTIVTLSQKTQNDMMSWSSEMEEERDELIEQFVTGAQDICNSLAEAGYWADFIDPTSGRPYLGAYTNASLFETDDRYRRLGFELEDLGCCKVIRHHEWGSHAYVGCLFTNAPLHHNILQQVTKI